MKERRSRRKAIDGNRDDERFLSVSAVARMFSVTEVTIKNWESAGRLRGIRTVGGHRRIARSSVVALLEAQGRAIPEELADARPHVLLALPEALVASIRKHLDPIAVVSVADAPFPLALAAARLRPPLLIAHVGVLDDAASALLLALRRDPSTRATDLILLGDGAPPRLLLDFAYDGGVAYFFRADEHAAIAAAAAAMLRRRS